MPKRYNQLFEEADVVICWKRGIYKFLKKPSYVGATYLPYDDVVKFLELEGSDCKVLYCDHLENIVECNFLYI